MIGLTESELATIVLDKIRWVREYATPLPKKIRMTEDEARLLTREYGLADPDVDVVTSLYSIPVEVVHQGTLDHYGRWEW